MLLQIAGAQAAFLAAPLLRPEAPWWFLPLVAGSALFVLGGLGLFAWWFLLHRKRPADAEAQAQRGIDKNRLTNIWDRFQRDLPTAVRAVLPGHAHFLVLGAAGAGKSTLIQRKVDWQGQVSQFLPSYTADPLLQIYLGSKRVVQELSGTLLDSTSRATNDALARLFRKIDAEQPPTVVIALKVSSLTLATPDELRLQAQLMRGKINLLSEAFGAPIPTRICLTHMDRTQGYGDVARFLRRNKIPLELPIGADAGLLASLQAYEKYLPRALITLPVAPFQANVEFLLAAEDILGPVRSFVQALLEGGLTSARPELEKLYFFSPAADEQVGNPFEVAARSEQASRLSWLRRLLYQLGIRPLHASLGAALLLAGLIALSVMTRRHAALVERATEATSAFDAAVQRAQEARSTSSESDVVRRSELEASQALSAVRDAESRFRPLRVLFRQDKAAAQRRFIDAIRTGYLLPELDRSVRQRSRERILFALVTVYATNHNTLGALVRAQTSLFSSTIEVSSDILLDYVRASDTPWRELALRLLPPLPSESSRFPVSDLRPWQELVRAVQGAIPQPYITLAQLKGLQQEAGRLLETLAQVRKAALLRQILHALSEESPLDMVRLFGRDAGALAPHPFLVDHAEPLQSFLTLIHDSSLSFGSGGRMTLFRLLKWINDLGSAPIRSAKAGDADKLLEDVIYYLPFPDERPSEISRRAWLELLLRSRKRLLLAYQISKVSAGARKPSECCGCAAPKKRRVCRPAPCPTGGCECSSRKERRASKKRCAEGSARSAEHGTDLELPLWEREELTSKLTALMSSDDPPSDGLEDLYNRAILEREVLPLIKELKKALSGSKALTPDEKLRLSGLVKTEVGEYARRYCAGLLRYYLSYRFTAQSPLGIHGELLNLIKPGSRFLTHLQVVADNVRVAGLEEPYLRSLAQCLAELQPIALLVEPAPRSVPPRSDAGTGQSADKAGAKDPPGGSAPSPPPSRPPASLGVPAGLQPYKEAVSKLLNELDGEAAAGLGSQPAPLAERLGPLGRTALSLAEGRPATPLRLAEKFLDDAGISGELRRPFLLPFQAAYREGAEEIEKAMAQHWQGELLPQLVPLFGRFPFNRSAEREVAPAELDVLSEARGAFFTDLKTFYAPVLIERSGMYQQKPSLGSEFRLTLPKDMLKTVNRLARLSRALFLPDGSRQPLRLAISGLPGRTVQEERTTQTSTAFLQVGRAAAYGFNQQPAAVPLSVDWWDQGVAVVGIESTTSRTGRKQTQSIEVADSAWSLFRLLQKATLEADGVSTWRLLGDGPAETQALRFVIKPEPWSLFEVQLP